MDNGWTDTAVAIHQAGGIRTSIEVTSDKKITTNDIITALPYGSKIYKVNLKGDTLLKALEWSVHDRIDENTTSHGGCFLQYSGIQVLKFRFNIFFFFNFFIMIKYVGNRLNLIK